MKAIGLPYLQHDGFERTLSQEMHQVKDNINQDYKRINLEKYSRFLHRNKYTKAFRATIQKKSKHYMKGKVNFSQQFVDFQVGVLISKLRKNIDIFDTSNLLFSKRFLNNKCELLLVIYVFFSEGYKSTHEKFLSYQNPINFSKIYNPIPTIIIITPIVAIPSDVPKIASVILLPVNAINPNIINNAGTPQAITRADKPPFDISIHLPLIIANNLKHLWASLFSKDLHNSGDIFDTPNRDAHTYSQFRILSMTIAYSLYTFKSNIIKNNLVGIPSPIGGFERSKTSGYTSQITLSLMFIRFQDKLFIIMVMSPVKSHPPPDFKEYFQLPYGRVYKECNRYKIANITLEDFGLKIDQGKRELPKVWSNDNMIITAPNESIKEDADKPFCCKYCGSENYTKYGKENNKQMYKCKECGHKFVDNLFFERMKADPKIICLTLDLYFKGVSLRKISDHLRQFYGLDVYFTTIYRWIEKYVEIINKYVSQFKPKIGEIWNADEMMVNIHGEWFYLWNVMDDESRFHLASVISKERKIQNARKVFQVAKKRSHGDKPRCIVTDGLQSYQKAINKEFHTMKKETIHIGNVGIRGKRFRNTKFDNNLIERLQGTVRERNKVQRGLKSEETIFVRGHQLYYNFIRPHMSLFGHTPAEASNINLNLGDKKWENLLMQSVKNNRSDTSSDK